MNDQRLLNAPLPIVAAPMAGGPTTPELVTAVTEAGGFGFLAGGYRTPDALAADIARVRGRTDRFGVNLFAPGASNFDRQAFHRYVEELQTEADAHDIELDPEPVVDDDHWDDKLRLLIEQPVPVVSLTFALPDPATITALRRAGSRVLATVTTPEEAREAQTAGVDGLIVQGPSAGGHSATFDPARPLDEVSTGSLVRDVRSVVTLPLIAAGGVDGPVAVRELLDAGAEAVAVGTLLLRTDEAGTSATHRSALADPAFTETVITRAFTGRPARALRNGFTDRHTDSAINAYPAVHHLTRELRQAAGRRGDTERLHLWAGTGYRNAPTGRAADVIGWLSDTHG
ncbi:nitronate monooxygenase [Enemella sp. A6]|uniref:nitronate monooxygenase n=1 Tax=Enemella sp. A6 TaxID=3440152 RepID=UPI003EBC495D